MTRPHPIDRFIGKLLEPSENVKWLEQAAAKLREMNEREAK